MIDKEISEAAEKYPRRRFIVNFNDGTAEFNHDNTPPAEEYLSLQEHREIISSLPKPEVGDEFKKFMRNVEMTAGCWFWNGQTAPNGYGRFYSKGKTHPAHRWAYEYLVGPITRDDACHLCDIRHCVNPAHIFDGTRSENMQDAGKKDRLKDNAHLHGELHPLARLSEEQVLEIMTKEEIKVMSARAVARKYNINAKTISRLRKKEVYVEILKRNGLL